MKKRFLPGALKNEIIKKKNVPSKRHASQGSIEFMPLYFKVIDKRSASVVGSTANVLSVVAAEANRGCPAPAPAATVASCARRRAAPCLGDLNGQGCPAPPLLRQLLREHADGLRRRASQGPIESKPVYFKALDKRSAIFVGPTANVLNIVAAEADGGCPASAPAATVPSCARRLAAPGLGDLPCKRPRLFRPALAATVASWAR